VKFAEITLSDNMEIRVWYLLFSSISDSPKNHMAMTSEKPLAVNLNLLSPQRPVYLFLLIYRWASLLLAMWLFLFSPDVIVPGVSLSALLAISLGSTLILTILPPPFQLKLFEKPVFLAFDLVLAIALLAFSGASGSPFSLYALTPLLTSALFFQTRGAIATLGVFSLFYPLTLLVIRTRFASIMVDPGQLFNQLIQAWLIIFLFGSLSTLLQQLRRANQSLTSAHNDLTRRNMELVATYRHLEVTHELTLFLHAPDRQSVQQQLLKAVTKEFAFPRAIVGIVNETGRRLERWYIYPPMPDTVPHPPPLNVETDEGPLAQAVFDQQVKWVLTEESLVTSETLKYSFGVGNWLVLPMVWQEQTVGVLIANVEQVGELKPDDERWPILTSLVSQAAVALGTIDKTRRLAVEQERNRIARDIHDTVAQSLFGIVFTLDACVKMLPAQPDVVKSELEELRNVADKVRHQVRRSVLDLWPTELTREQFQLDLDKHLKHCCPLRLFNVDYTIDGDFDYLSPALRRGLYRVCQEALSNAAQHAQVDTARVYLFVAEDQINLSVRDKGKGLTPDRLWPGSVTGTSLA
jgi:signal transduction histidine kinase